MYSLIRCVGAWVLGAWVVVGCADKPSNAARSFYNVDSLVNEQVHALAKHELAKSVKINGKEEQTRFTPDSTQWGNELEIFRQLDQVNKASYRDAYVVSDARDLTSNLTVREIKAQRPVPVTLFRVYYLHTPDDVRKIEATFVEENTLYVNTRRMTLELERNHVLQRFRVEGSQKMVMSDSVDFVIAGTIE